VDGVLDLGCITYRPLCVTHLLLYLQWRLRFDYISNTSYTNVDQRILARKLDDCGVGTISYLPKVKGQRLMSDINHQSASYCMPYEVHQKCHPIPLSAIMSVSEEASPPDVPVSYKVTWDH